MHDLSSLYAFLVVGGLLSVTPGPNMVYVISRSITQGRRAGLTSLGGVVVGYLFTCLALRMALQLSSKRSHMPLKF